MNLLRERRAGMVNGGLDRNRIEKLLAEHGDLTLQTAFSRQGQVQVARLSIVAETDYAEDLVRLKRKAARSVSLESWGAVATVVGVIVAISLASLVAWALPLAFALGLCALIVRRLKLRRRLETIRRLHQSLDGWEFTHPVEKSWRAAAEHDETISWMVSQWMLTMLDIEQLKKRIDDGVDVQKQLSPTDPLRSAIGIEIETLVSRRDGLQDSAESEADRIDEHVRDYSDAEKREALKEQRRALIAATEARNARDLDQRMRAAESTERQRLANQERAQKWLYYESDK